MRTVIVPVFVLLTMITAPVSVVATTHREAVIQRGLEATARGITKPR